MDVAIQSQVLTLPDDFPLCPIRLKSKQPYGAAWQQKPETPDEVAAHNGVVNGAGLILGFTDHPAFDGFQQGFLAADVDGPDVPTWCLNNKGINVEALPTTWTVASGRYGRSCAIYRVPQAWWGRIQHTVIDTGIPVPDPTPGKKGETQQLELRWTGHQQILCGIHPTSGGTYQWVDGGPDSNLPIAEAPEWLLKLMAADAAPAADTATDWLPADGKAIPEQDDDQPVEPVLYKDWWTLDDGQRARLCMQHMPPSIGGNYNTWIKVGAALYAVFQGQDDGFQLFLQWSRRAPGFSSSADCRKRWNSFARQPKQRPGVGTLVPLASMGGLCRPPKPKDAADDSGDDFDVSDLPLETRLDLFETELEHLAATEANYKRRIIKGLHAASKQDGLNVKYSRGDIEEKLKQYRQKALGHEFKLIGATEEPELSSYDEDEWYVEGLLLKGQLTIVGGAPKTSKTILVIAALKAMLDGQPFLDRKTRTPSKVLLLVSDQPGKQTVKYLDKAALFRHSAIQRAETFSFSEEHLDKLLSAVPEHDWKDTLIIIDSLRSTSRGSGIDENSPMIADIIYDLQASLCKLGATILIIHHSKKGAEEAGPDALRGSSALGGAASGVLILQRPQKKDEFSGHAGSDITSPQRRLAFNGRGEPVDIRIQHAEGDLFSWSFVSDEAEAKANTEGSYASRGKRRDTSGNPLGRLSDTQLQILWYLSQFDMANPEAGLPINDIADHFEVLTPYRAERSETDWTDELAKAYDSFSNQIRRLSTRATPLTRVFKRQGEKFHRNALNPDIWTPQLLEQLVTKFSEISG